MASVERFGPKCVAPLSLLRRWKARLLPISSPDAPEVELDGT